MNEQNPRQLQGIADLLATRGRYGDSMMVHMNPVEVQGLASMSPTGSLTINPDTGQPEAFLPFLAPILGGMLGSTALGGIVGSTALAGAIGSGLTTAIMEGDLKKGLISGITGFGIGAGLDKVLQGSTSAIAAGTQGVADSAASLTEGVASFTPPANVMDQVTGTFGQNASKTPLGDVANIIASPAPEELIKSLSEKAGETATRNTVSGMGFQERLSEFASRPGDTLKGLTSMPTLAAVGIGEGTNAQIRTDEMMEGRAKDQLRKKKQDYESSLARRDASYFPGYQKPYGDSYTQYASSGGIVSLDPSDFERRMTELQQLGRPVKKMFPGGGIDLSGINLSGREPAKVSQGGLRDPFSISPEQLQQTYQDQGLPGFGPEIMYFTPEKGKDPNPFEGWTPDPVAVEETGTQADITLSLIHI